MKKLLSIAMLTILYTSNELSCSNTDKSIDSIESYSSIEASQKSTNRPTKSSVFLNTFQQAAITSYKVVAPIAHAAAINAFNASNKFTQETLIPFIQAQLTHQNNSSINMVSILQKKNDSLDDENTDLDTDKNSDFYIVPSEEERLSYFYDEETLQINLNADATTAMYEYGQAIESFFSKNPEDIATQRQMSHVFELAQKVKHQGNAFVLAQITAKAHREKQKEILKKSITKHAETIHISSEKLELAMTTLDEQRDAEIEKIKAKFHTQKMMLTQKHTTQLKQICAEIKTIDENLIYIDQCSGNETGHKKLCNSKNYANIDACKAFLVETYKQKTKEKLDA